LGLRDLMQEDPANTGEFSIAELPTGWLVLFANDVEFASAERLATLSQGATLVACQVEEHSMISAAHGWRDGAQLWSITHDPERASDDLSVLGAPPPAFAAIREKLFTEQATEEENDEPLPVDYIFDIPVALAENLTGYRHDRWRFDWGEPRFVAAGRP
jgi:hypothetical protein